MKKKFIFSLFLIAFSTLLFLTTNVNAQIKVSTNGYVTIGDTYTASEKMEVSGRAKFRCNLASSGIVFENYYSSPVIKPQDVTNFGYIGMGNRRFSTVYSNYVRCTYLVQGSDRKLKENIRELNGSLQKIELLKPVVYDFRKEIYDDSTNFSREKDIANRMDHTGFIAQDVQEVFPKLVEYNDEVDYLEMNYIGLIPELVRAIQEQQEIIDSLSIIIEEISVTKSLKALSTNLTESVNSGAILYQNSPNPFNERTKIKAVIPESVNYATINIYNLNGEQLESNIIQERGTIQLEIHSNKHYPGIYLYSLLVDGRVIDSKQMVLTD